MPLCHYRTYYLVIFLALLCTARPVYAQENTPAAPAKSETTQPAKIDPTSNAAPTTDAEQKRSINTVQIERRGHRQRHFGSVGILRGPRER